MFNIDVRFPRVNIRRGPSVNFSSLIFLEETGQQFEAIGRTEDSEWVQICCVDAENGWVLADVISAEGNVSALSVADAPPPLAIIEVERLNVRAGPQVAFDSIGEVVQEEAFEILARNQVLDWYKICCVDGQEGWVFSGSVTIDGDLDLLPIGND